MDGHNTLLHFSHKNFHQEVNFDQRQFKETDSQSLRVYDPSSLPFYVVSKVQFSFPSNYGSSPIPSLLPSTGGVSGSPGLFDLLCDRPVPVSLFLFSIQTRSRPRNEQLESLNEKGLFSRRKLPSSLPHL